MIIQCMYMYMYMINVVYTCTNIHTCKCLACQLLIICLYVCILLFMTLDMPWHMAEHWTSNPVVTGSNPIRGSSVFFSLSAFGLCLTCFPLF